MDIQYLLFLQQIRELTGSAFNEFFLFITKFGEGIFPYLLVMWFYWAVDKKLGSRMLFGISFSAMINGIIKLTACVYRPWIRDAAVVPPGNAKLASTGYSFPSGHTANATVSFGTLAWHYRRWSGLCWSLASVLVLVMFSRNFLGVHTPQDVVVSFVCTVVTMMLVYQMLGWAEAGKNRDILILAGTILLAGISLYYFLHKGYPLDYLEGQLIVDPQLMMPDSFISAGAIIGVALGWVLERRFICFLTDVPLTTRVARFVSGALIYVLICYAGMIALRNVCGSLWGSFLAGFIAFFYCVAIHPMLFCWLERCKKTGGLKR